MNRYVPVICLITFCALGQSVLNNTSGTSTYGPVGSIATMTDADNTLTVGTSAVYQIVSATLTGNRTVTLSTAGAVAGSRFVVIRKGLGLFTLSVGGLKLMPSATSATVAVIYNGSTWQLEYYSLL